MLVLETKSPKETQKIAGTLAKEIANKFSDSAIVITLEGDLGSGKTTFVRGFARALGVKEKISSPTFILMKTYPLRRQGRFKHLVHIDCYRLGKPKELLHLGFRDLIKDKDGIILIEWADKIKKILPKNAVKISFRHISPNKRKVIFSPELVEIKNRGAIEAYL